MKSIRALSIVTAASAALLLLAGQAAAHATLVGSTPVANATVAAPKTITLTFSEKVVPAFSGFDLAMLGHDMKLSVKTKVTKDGRSIVGSPKGKLMAGAYRVTWRAASSDGHRMTGTVDFKIG